MRSAFQVESLQPRILLSADPAGAAAQLLVLRDVDELRLSQATADALRLQALTQATAGQAPLTLAAPLAGTTAADAPAQADFAVDAGAPDSAYLDATLAVPALAQVGDLQLDRPGPARPGTWTLAVSMPPVW